MKDKEEKRNNDTKAIGIMQAKKQKKKMKKKSENKQQNRTRKCTGDGRENEEKTKKR